MWVKADGSRVDLRPGCPVMIGDHLGTILETYANDVKVGFENPLLAIDLHILRIPIENIISPFSA